MSVLKLSHWNTARSEARLKRMTSTILAVNVRGYTYNVADFTVGTVGLNLEHKKSRSKTPFAAAEVSLTYNHYNEVKRKSQCDAVAYSDNLHDTRRWRGTCM